jgi:N-acetyl-anhydromuramoyl-L-alanine amidase
MEIDKLSGLLQGVRYLPSSNHDARPENMPIDMIVIHNISLPPGQFGSGAIERFFCDQLDMTQHPYFQTIADLKVSSHLLIDRKGVITQFVPFHKRAWHAGVSCFEGRERCNDFSIGIELEGTDDLPFESAQYDALVNVIHLLMQEYPLITRDRIVGHSDIAPGRKTDPGAAFDWNKLFIGCSSSR